MRIVTSALLLGALLSGLLTACTQESSAAQPSVLRFTGIPDADKDRLSEQYALVAAHLESELGLPVEYVHVPDYTGAVTALAANKVDLVWLGGVTAIQAEERTDGATVFLAARARDLRFRTYFVARRELVQQGRFEEVLTRDSMPLAQLGALRDALAECRFSFGAKSSTSGHVMPRHFLTTPEVGIDPEHDFAAAPSFQLVGGHHATLRAVADGAVDVGALNYATWEQADEATRQAAPVVYVTPEYVDYCLISHERLGEELNARLRAAFTSLSPERPHEAAVLNAFNAQRFVEADPAAWDGIRAVLAGARDRGLFE